MKAVVRHLIFVFLSSLLPLENYCQKILEPDYPYNVRWDNFLVKDGEASQTSLCIFIDSKGFLWSGTETGLYRYDGIRYVEYGVSSESNKGFTGFSVTNIFEDSEGTIWIGTSEALNKLDQKTGTFKHFIPDSANRSEISNFIRAIREDRDGLLWVLTKKYIYSFDKKREKFTRFIIDSLSWYPQYDIPNEDQCYTEDSLGNKWFVTFRGLYLYNINDRTFRMVLPDPDNGEVGGIRKIKCVNTDKDGTLWIGTDGEGLLKWNYFQNKPGKIDIWSEGTNRESFNSVSAILSDKNGSLWSFGNGSFSYYNPEDKSFKNYMFVHRYRSLYEPPGSEIWIDQAFQYDDGTIWFFNKQAGLMFRFDPMTEKLSLYRTPNFAVFHCIMDKTGSFWFACIRNNIFRLVTDQIPYLTIQVNNTSHVASIHRGSFLEDDQTRTYFLFLPGIYICKNFDVSSSIILDQFTFSDGCNIAGGGFKDSKGNFWFGNKDGDITKYNPLTQQLTVLTHQSSPGYTEVVFVPLIREDNTGIIWVATSKELFRVNSKNEKLDHILDFKYKSGDENIKLLEDFLIDSQGTFWILTSESLLSIKMPEMKITDYAGYGNGIFSSTLTNIRVGEDSKGNIFILNLRYGVYQHNRQNESFLKVDIIKEEPGSEYYDMLIDRNDRLWIAHNRGITIYDPQIKSSRHIKTPKLQFDVQSFQTKSGHMLYLNDNRLYIFYENPPVNNYIPPVYITRLLVNGIDYNKILTNENDVNSLKKIDLPFKLNTLSIEFAALNYLNPERNQYRYFMEGFDRDTALIGQGIPAEYKNMPPGRYRFWVTGSNNDGIWNQSEVSLKIRIHPPWYRSGLAFTAYLLLFFSIVAGYIRFRIYRLTRDKIKLRVEIDAATAELETKNRLLEETDRIKTHFFTDISHEIRTPLSLILGPLEYISREEIPGSRMAGMVEMMKRNAQRLMNLVNQLLDISRLDAGKMKITLAEDDIIKCLRILVYEFLSMAESKHIRYIADLPDRAFITWFDRDKTEKIISNLLTNAFKYTPENGSVQCVVRIEAAEKDNNAHFLQIMVLDSGPGISSEHQTKIFDRFYRIEDHYEADGHGTGIGLSLVQEFVSLLHGEIKVESIPGKGSIFSVALPLGKEHLSADEYVILEPTAVFDNKQFTYSIKQKYPLVPSGSAHLENGKMKVLIIEDNADLRDFIRDSICDEYNVLEAENGRTGINTAFTTMPDLIVTDILMPDLDGISLCSQLKNDERTSHIPIIMVTAKATTEDRITGLKSGADDYIIKPFNIYELKTRISNLLLLRDKLKIKYSRFHIPESGEEMSGSVDDRFMVRVLRTIYANIRDYDFDVGSLQEMLGMSRTHLFRKLKVLTGLPPGMMIRNIRLEKAAELLVNKKGNITEIANSIGMSNPSNFTKAFRNYFGVSPKDYPKL